MICGLILLVAFSMSELASTYPDRGRPLLVGGELGGPGWSWFTGWFNVIGLVGDRRLRGLRGGDFLNLLFSL